jgi:hypothetical protein
MVNFSAFEATAMNADQTLKDGFHTYIENFKFSVFSWVLVKRDPLKLKKKFHFRLFEKTIKKAPLINDTETPGFLCVEISSEKISRLLEQHLICAADIRCLNVNSKQCLKKLYLKTCLYNNPPVISASQLLGDSAITNREP